MTKSSTTARVLVIVVACTVAASLSRLTALHVDQRSGGPRPSQRSSSWRDNGFSSATSGKLFQMRAWRQFRGERIFQDSGTHRPELHKVEGAFPRHSDLSCAVWAVVTTVSSPTTTVLQLARLASKNKLCLVVVGDRKTPSNFTLGPNSIYLSPEEQIKLPYAILQHVPWNHFGRKNVGFMYAVHHGASQIYDTDDDNELARLAIPRLERMQPMAFDTDYGVLNPYPCFSEEAHDDSNIVSWPRGFPLERIKDPRAVSCTLRNATRSEVESIAVVQSLADHDPDVDAIFRLTRPLPMYFEPRRSDGTDVAVIPSGTFTPYNAQATMYDRRAMWGLLLPITVHGRVSDIWRSYITQSIMWSAGLRLAMARPWVVQRRNAHNYLADLQAEDSLYYQAGALLEYFSSRQTHRATTESIPRLVEATHIDMYEHGVLEMADVLLAQAWLLDFVSVNYTFPVRKMQR